MARPQKNNVDYFPFICEEGNKMFYLEEIYGNDGFATFVKLLRELARTDFHYLNLSKTSTTMYLSAKCKVSKDVLIAIINDLVDLGKFDDVLWNENKIIWCQDFINGIQDAYKKRNNKCITYDGLLALLSSLGVRKPNKRTPKEPENPQSKVKNSKGDENKVNVITPIFAYDFIKKEKQSELEIFEMQNKKSFPDYEKFIENFNNKVVMEQLEFEPNVLLARLRMLNTNWDKKPKLEKKEITSGKVISKLAKYGTRSD